MRKPTIAALQSEISGLRVYESYFYCQRNGRLNRRERKHGIALEAWGLERASGGVIVVDGYVRMFDDFRVAMQQRASRGGLQPQDLWMLETVNRWADEVREHFAAA